jgi:hypothetical protein
MNKEKCRWVAWVGRRWWLRLRDHEIFRKLPRWKHEWRAPPESCPNYERDPLDEGVPAGPS